MVFDLAMSRHSAGMHVHVLPMLDDNYSYVIEDGDRVMVVDPSEASPVIQLLKRLNRTLTHILITHHHADHTGGVDALCARYAAKIIDAHAGANPLPGIEAIETPGHCFPHTAYYLRAPGWLFSGDCLFGAGCGRLFGDSAVVMWASLGKLAALPDNTVVYFGHEYTLDNLAFAAAVEPENRAITERRARVSAALASGGFSTPSTIAEEKLTNPFLRAGDAETFAALRRKKNSFVA